MSQKKINSTNTLNEFYLEERCTLNKVLKIVGKRWVSEILLLIKQDVSRFSNLKECLNGISDNVLSSVLNELVNSKLIEKEIFKQIPLRVEYRITQSGLELTDIMHQLCAWGKVHIPYVTRMKPSFN
ncbi:MULTISPECIES: helix-turn-helix domain-containing protein [unclassified Mucilaginibacter]|uniref:winged helix-turn-helix transcriptional regulator n=1 Tax=unclassified Mucilaginibacter TaxID=2617802 RepID=UPI002AC99B0E|nr:MULTISPECIES: helix-turn-helix domain-containing protein [unclassified Mucilaginibacter]MEB0263802.1 helix-turn-helix domain-containing protein [Mucilaginibacter sp. 10I4]MEB0277003.1 helix-turn-helix domain-containing protein [Mucilaginibacter sp. 10B2]MEB0302623.1 helix-turn-helix domain-containing protein [Mucilaginibacter sp. 5C4]WPX25103.1 helix-turn-helix domain-containing protein [Mucilaginibacter sp. 5C4]